MEFTSSNNRDRVIGIFQQIENAIEQLKNWNANIETAEDYYLSPDGMQKLAASCMLIEAIGEGVHQIDRITEGELFKERSGIPWEDVIGIRNHIAHGYFDIDGEVVLLTIRQDLDPLLEAVRYFINSI